MTRFERRRFFERLCQLRALYRLRTDDDMTSAISIAATIAYAERLLGDSNALAEALGSDDAGDPSATTSATRRP
jgi:hypothetical protein